MVESMQQSSAIPSLHLGFLGLRKIVACSQPYLAVASCIYSFWHGVIPTSYFIFNDFYTCIITSVRCRDDTVPKTVDTRSHCKVWLRACNNLPQPPKKRDVGRGLWKIVACSQPHLAVASCIYCFWHGVIPTSSYDFYTCFTHFP